LKYQTTEKRGNKKKKKKKKILGKGKLIAPEGRWVSHSKGKKHLRHQKKTHKMGGN